MQSADSVENHATCSYAAQHQPKDKAPRAHLQPPNRARDAQDRPAEKDDHLQPDQTVVRHVPALLKPTPTAGELDESVLTAGLIQLFPFDSVWTGCGGP